ncbi:MAG: hypothetical protein ACRD0P_04385 [Stackebrandtia sp.]
MQDTSEGSFVDVTSGLELLATARSADPDELRELVGQKATTVADYETRAGLVATLLSAHTVDDVELIRRLTRFEMALVRDDDDIGCGDVLLACCWLLFRIGHIEDSALIWEAKQINFDTASHIEAVFLIPAGIDATEVFALRNALDDLAEYVTTDWLRDEVDTVEGWREGRYFASRPAPDRPVPELAAWMLS